MCNLSAKSRAACYDALYDVSYSDLAVSSPIIELADGSCYVHLREDSYAE